LAVLAAGMGFTGLALALSVGAQRRDFGRRRALGASRSLLMTFVILEGAMPAALGALVGTAGGVTILALIHGVTADPAFVASVPILAILAVVLASIPVALAAAFRDPVAILRVP
ncbi:MAG: FtsX-like permease family protein, partial [Promicromonosporaceae bacterium]|nr:FtsX-like permease family protein [Promicromonosporaceae bacterium]